MLAVVGAALPALLVLPVADHAAAQAVTSVTVEAGRSDLADRWRPNSARGFLGLDQERNRAGVLLQGLPAGWNAPVGRFGAVPSFGGGVYVGRRRAGAVILADYARGDRTRLLLFRFGGYFRLWGE